MTTREAATVREWTDLVRRARLGRTVKLVALVLATYADGDGGRIFPGVARLSVDTEVSYNTVKAALATLREAGLITRVRAAQARGDADEYRLTIGEETGDRVDVLTPAQVSLAISRVRETKQGRYRTGDLRPTGEAADSISGKDLRPTSLAAGPVDNPDLRPDSRAAGSISNEEPAAHYTGRSNGPAAHLGTDLRPTSLAPTHQDLDTTTTNQPLEDVRTAVTVTREPGQDRDFSEEDQPPPPCARGTAPVVGPRCRHGFTDTGRVDGQPSCALCRREAIAAPTQSLPLVVPRDPPDGLAPVIPIRRTA